LCYPPDSAPAARERGRGEGEREREIRGAPKRDGTERGKGTWTETNSGSWRRLMDREIRNRTNEEAEKKGQTQEAKSPERL
jgi:hypothetical protein